MMSELITYIFGSASELEPVGLMSFFCFVLILDLIGNLIGGLTSAARGK